MLGNPWDKWVDGVPAEHRKDDYRIELEVGGEMFTVDLLKSRGEAADRQGKSEGVATFSHREIHGLKHATGGQPLPPEMTKAILRVKMILGGTITGAKVTS